MSMPQPTPSRALVQANDLAKTFDVSAPWFSPSHPGPADGAPVNGYDADGYPVPVAVEVTGPAA